jgi:Ca2+-binding EF-hand superfamily protein
MPAKKGVRSKRKYTRAEIAQMREIFNSIDTDHSGGLDVNEITHFLEQAGDTGSIAPLILRIFDRNRDGAVTFDEFVEFLELSAKAEAEPLVVYRALFDAIDTDSSGELNAPEIREFARVMGITLTASEATDVVHQVDKDGNGTVSFDELMMVLELN